MTSYSFLYGYRPNHGKLMARVEVYEDGYIIFETKKEKQEGFTSAMQDTIQALMFLVKSCVYRSPQRRT